MYLLMDQYLQILQNTIKEWMSLKNGVLKQRILKKIIVWSPTLMSSLIH